MTSPGMTIPTYDRTYALRRPRGFEPTVQRWSVSFPTKYDHVYVSFLGVQARSVDALNASAFHQWFCEAMHRPDAPVIHDHARHVDGAGYHTHIVTAYWLSPEHAGSWKLSSDDWWCQPARLEESCGYFREQMTIPLDRQETLYWQDYPAALSKCKDVGIYPTPYCGYYGAMRDRIPLAAIDSLACTETVRLTRNERSTMGAHWRIDVPHNMAVIRSATYWGRCDLDQEKDFFENLRGPLDNGMTFLKENHAESGCCTMRYQQTCDATGNFVPETHALAYFISLAHMEHWAERHTSHHAIFKAAMDRYRKYGNANQLRTWHEVYVLPEGDQSFDYINCHAATGLLPYFNGIKLS